MLILSRTDVLKALDGEDASVCRTVADTYVAHARGQTAVPHSVFLRFPDQPQNRIIALPAFVGGRRPVAAVKWIASFPNNIARGMERASGAILLNSVDDGRPIGLVEGAVISARRTAASAALAAGELTAGAPDEVRAGVSLLGCGVINFEVVRFLRARLTRLSRVTLYDIDPRRTADFAIRVRDRWSDLKVEVSDRIDDAMAAHHLVSLATTAAQPHLDLAACRPGSVVLHLSLRDLTPESILGVRNVVDDADHVCRAATSLDLAQRLVGDRRFITAEIGDLLAGTDHVPYRPDSAVVFSPFGLGALDAALAAHVVDVARALGLGVDLGDFATDLSKEHHVV